MKTLHRDVVGGRYNRERALADLGTRVERTVLESRHKGPELSTNLSFMFFQEGLALAPQELAGLVAGKLRARDLAERLEKERRYRRFVAHPVIEDLREDPELLHEVEQATKDQNSECSQAVLGMYQNMTHEEMRREIKARREWSIWHAKLAPSNWVCTAALVVLTSIAFAYLVIY